jgi:hypothetical protein
MGRTACTEPQCLYSRAIPLFPLWAVWPVQSFSACTVELYLLSSYGPYDLYRASVPVQVCTLPLPYLPYKIYLAVSCKHSFKKASHVTSHFCMSLETSYLLDAFANLRKRRLGSSCLSVHTEQHGTNCTDLHEIWYLIFLSKSCRKN